MSDYRSRLRAIQESQARYVAGEMREEDTAPHLAAADWLEGRGTPVAAARAEFVRRMIDFERTPAGDPARHETARRLQQIFDAHWREWFGPLLGLEPGAEGRVPPLRFDPDD